MNYSKQIDDAIRRYEEGKSFKIHNTEWICNRIEWCWKWKKITEQEMNDFCERIIKILDNELVDLTNTRRYNH